MSVVVALSGSIGSGKSHLARALAGRLGCPTAAFGALVRREAAARDLPATRAALQDLGERLLADDGSGERTDSDALRGLSELSYGQSHEWGMP